MPSSIFYLFQFSIHSSREITPGIFQERLRKMINFFWGYIIFVDRENYDEGKELWKVSVREKLFHKFSLEVKSWIYAQLTQKSTLKCTWKQLLFASKSYHSFTRSHHFLILCVKCRSHRIYMQFRMRERKKFKRSYFEQQFRTKFKMWIRKLWKEKYRVELVCRRSELNCVALLWHLYLKSECNFTNT